MLATEKFLPESCSKILTLIIQMRAAQELGAEPELRERIKKLLKSWEHDCRRADVAQKDINIAKFALVAFIDETLTTSSWSEKETWSAAPLQAELFNRGDAGKEFFVLLEQLRKRRQAHPGLLEVFYLCMALGFEGQYQDEQNELQTLIEEVQQEIAAAAKTPMMISPHGRPQEERAAARRSGPSLWLIGGVALLLCLIIYIGLAISMNNESNDTTTLLKDAAASTNSRR
jgi:type VI secretion system protein ImpK